MDNMDRLLRAAAQGERPHLPQEEVWEALAWAGARKPSPLGRWARYGAMAVAALLLSLGGGYLGGLAARPPQTLPAPVNVAIPKTDGGPDEAVTILEPTVDVPKTDTGLLHIDLGEIPVPPLPAVEGLDELRFGHLPEGAREDPATDGLERRFSFPEGGSILLRLHPAGSEYAACADGPREGMGLCAMLVDEITGEADTVFWRLRLGEGAYLEIECQDRPFAEALAFVQGITVE